jgi:hypothetical protein
VSSVHVHREEIGMSLVSDPDVTHVVVAAWHCEPCEVQGRSVVDAGVECWNCGGSVTVTARPSLPVAEFECGDYAEIPHPRVPRD